MGEDLTQKHSSPKELQPPPGVRGPGGLREGTDPGPAAQGTKSRVVYVSLPKDKWKVF